MQVRFRKRLTVALPALLAASLLAACSSSGGNNNGSGGSGGATSAPGGSSPATGKVTDVRVASVLSIGTLAVEVAKEQGFFKNHNLNVTTKYVTDPTTLPAAMGQQFDVGFTVQTIFLSAANSGLSVKAIAGGQADTVANPQVGLLVAGNSSITKPADLKGKTIGTVALPGTVTIATKALLDSVGVGPTQANYVTVPFPNMADQLKAGQVQAVIAANPFSQEIQSSGGKNLGDPFSLTPEDDLLGMWMASSKWADANPQAAKDFQAAISEATDWMAQNSDAAKTLLVNFTKIPAAVIQAEPVPTFKAAVTAQDLTTWVDFMKKYLGFQPKSSLDVNSLLVS